MDFSGFKNYYFMKCFSEEKHRQEFNSGEKAYINSTTYFHHLEDEFKRDFEGGVFQQKPNTYGFLIASKSQLSVDTVKEKVLTNRVDEGELWFKTENCKIYINGYLFCLTLIPKDYIAFRDNELVFNEEYNIREAFYYLLARYNEKAYTFVSVYDAERFMNIFYPQMASR
ncbi:MAG: hypothetical protein IJP07_03755, partial [Firmicutes bacterium]|nr:hypothetical protein [Bacillota bacterium]